MIFCQGRNQYLMGLRFYKMIKDYRPYYIKKAWYQLQHMYIRHKLLPQLSHLGKDPFIKEFIQKNTTLLLICLSEGHILKQSPLMNVILVWLKWRCRKIGKFRKTQGFAIEETEFLVSLNEYSERVKNAVFLSKSAFCDRALDVPESQQNLLEGE